MEEFLSLWQKLSGAGTAGILFAILWAGYRQYWVWGAQLTEMRAERDEWKTIALRGFQIGREGTQLGQQGAQIAEKVLSSRP